MEPFADKITWHFAYEIGAGFMIPLAEKISGFIGYQYLSLGDAKLGRSPAQTTNNRINAGNIHIHQGVIGIKYNF